MQNCQLLVGSKECPINAIHKILRQSLTFQSNWSLFARDLNISRDRINSLRQDLRLDKITFADLVDDLLEVWTAGEASNAKLSQLIWAVEEIGDNNVGEKLRLEFNFPCKAADKNPSIITWEDVPSTFQQKVMKTLSRYYPEIQFSERMTELESDVLLQLMTGEKPTLFKSTLPDPITYYIKRTVSTRSIISTTIFQEEINSEKDMFLFGGMEQFELSRKVKGITSTSSNVNSSAHFVHLETELHVDQIIGTSGHPVHFLKKEVGERRDGRLRWIKSRGGMSTIQKHIDRSQEELGEEDFIDLLLKSGNNSNMPVCIGDTPGMGKSILLAKIGKEIKERQSESTVFFIVLSEFIKLFKEIETTEKLQAILIALQKAVSSNVIGETVLQSTILSSADGTIKYELLFDGFDEVDGEDLQLAHVILETIKTSFNSARLWITTRPHFLEELENNLSLLGYNIRPFIEDDQVQFLTSFWSRNTPSLNKGKLEKFALHCLKLLKERMDTKDQDIAGVPLQCLLIGEIYEGEALGYASFQANDDVSLPMPFIKVGTITNLYERLIEKKFSKYLLVTSGKATSGKAEMMNMHASLSLELLFPDHFKKLEHLFDPVEKEELLKIGILEAVSTTEMPRFIHRTFAEYFVARFVTTRLNYEGGWSEELNDLFLNVILKTKGTYTRSFEFSNSVVVYFVNFLIQHEDSEGLVIDSVTSYKFAPAIAYSCMHSDYKELFNFLRRMGVFDRQAAGIFDQEYILLAIKNSSIGLVDGALHYFEKYYKFDTNIKIKALREAVKRGDFYMVEFLIKKKELSWLLENLDYGTCTLLHDCLVNTHNHPDWKIKQKLEVIKLLVTTNPQLLEENDSNQSIPIFINLAHVRLVMELVKLGTSVLSRDKNGHTVLHSGALDWSHDEFHSFLTSIPDKLLKKLVLIKDDVGNTPLLSLVINRIPAQEALEIYCNAGANFNDANNHNNTVLPCAIWHKDGSETVKLLIKFGADIRWRGEDSGETILHLAAQWGNLDVVELLTEMENGLDVNVEDDDGLTPLNYTINYWNYGYPYDTYETGLALIQKGGTFKRCINPEGMSLLHVAAREGNLDALQLLIHPQCNVDHADVNEKDDLGNTPLHYCVQPYNYSTRKDEVYFSITQYLLENNANPNSLNALGETPFHVALGNPSLDLKTFQLLKSKTTMTPMLATQIIKFIFNLATRHHQQIGRDTVKWTEIAAESLQISSDEMQRFFEGTNVFSETASALFDDKALYRCVQQSDLEMFKFALELYEKYAELDSEELTKLFKKLVQRRKFSIVEYLIKVKGLRGTVEGQNATLVALIHDCVKHTSHITSAEIQERLKIVQLLNDKYRELLTGDLKSGLEALAASDNGIHTRLQTELGYNRAEFDYNFCSNSQDYHLHIVGIPESHLKNLINNKCGQSNVTPLLNAVTRWDLQPSTLDIFKNLGADFNSTNSYGYSILAVAISSRRSAETLRNLVKHGAKIDWKDTKTNKTLLHIAAEYRNVVAVQFLLQDHQVDPNVEDVNGETPLDYTICSTKSIYFDKRNSFEIGIILHYHGGKFGKSNTNGPSPLHFSANAGHDESVRLLTCLGNSVNITDENGDTPLHLALKTQRELQRPHGLHSTINILLLNNADPSASNNKGVSPMDIAFEIENIDPQTFLLLKSRADISWTPQRANFALKLVLKRKNETYPKLDSEELFLLIRECIDHGANVNLNVENVKSLLLLAMGERHWKIIPYLMEKKQAYVDLSSIEGELTAPRVLLSIKKGIVVLPYNVEILNFLISHGAAILEKSESGKHYISSGEYPTASQYRSIVKYIARKKLFCDGREEGLPLQLYRIVNSPDLQIQPLLDSPLVNTKDVDDHGDSIVTRSIKHNNRELLTSLVDQYGADLGHLNNNKNSFLHIAASSGTMDTLKYILDSNCCDVNGENLDGNTPLHVAGPDLKMHALLIERGADVNSSNQRQETPLHIFKSLEITKLLIDSGADAYSKCSRNQTFLHNFISKDFGPTPSEFHLMAEYLINKDLAGLFDIDCGGRYLMICNYQTQLLVDSPTPLLLATVYLHPAERTLTLLQLNGINFKAVDNEGNSVLSFAIRQCRSVEFLSTLITLGADPAHLNNKQESLLHDAANYGTAQSLKFLLSLEQLDVNGRNFDGNTPLHMIYCNQLYVTRNVDMLEKYKFLVDGGANIDSENLLGQTVLHQLASGKDWDNSLRALMNLIEIGADTCAKDCNNCTFLHHYLRTWRPQPKFHSLVELLVRKNCTSVLTTPGTIGMMPDSSATFIGVREALGRDEVTPLEMAAYYSKLEARTSSLLQSLNIEIPSFF